MTRMDCMLFFGHGASMPLMTCTKVPFEGILMNIFRTQIIDSLTLEFAKSAAKEILDCFIEWKNETNFKIPKLHIQIISPSPAFWKHHISRKKLAAVWGWFPGQGNSPRFLWGHDMRSSNSSPMSLSMINHYELWIIINQYQPTIINPLKNM